MTWHATCLLITCFKIIFTCCCGALVMRGRGFVCLTDKNKNKNVTCLCFLLLCCHLQSVSQLSAVSHPAAPWPPSHPPGSRAQVPVARHHGWHLHEARQQRGKTQKRWWSDHTVKSQLSTSKIVLNVMYICWKALQNALTSSLLSVDTVPGRLMWKGQKVGSCDRPCVMNLSRFGRHGGNNRKCRIPEEPSWKRASADEGNSDARYPCVNTGPQKAINAQFSWQNDI